MAVKSVIDVEVNSQAFTRFTEIFDKYREALAKTPNAWAKVSKENEATAKNFERMTAALMAQNQLAHERADQDKEHARQTSKIAEFWDSMSRNSTNVFRNVLGIGANLLKWGGLIGGIATGASLFGIDRMAEHVSAQRRSSMGLGMSIGQQKAFDINLSRFVDTGSFLSGINEAVSDVSKQGSLYALGINPNGSTADVAVATLKALRAKALATPTNQLGLLEQQYNLGSLGIGIQDLRRLQSASASEFNKQIAGARGDVGPLGISGAAALAWQNFTTNLEKIGGGLMATFATGLVRLSGPLTKLGTSIEHLIEHAMKPGGPLERGITTVGKWLDHLGEQMQSSGFQQDLDDLISAFGTAAGALGNIADDLPSIAQAFHVIAHPVDSANEFLQRTLAGGTAGAEKTLSDLESRYNLPKGLLDFQWGHESNRSFAPADSATGDMGPFQISQSSAGLLRINPYNFSQGASGAARIDAELWARYHDVRKVIAAYNLSEKARREDIDAHPNDWMSYIPKATRDYVNSGAGLSGANLNVNVTFNKIPGGYVPTVGAQLAGQ